MSGSKTSRGQMRILLVDNDVDFLETRAEFLEKENYEVVQATSVQQARQLLSEAHIHLAILDVRLTDDEDDRDFSGLTLAKTPAFRHIPKIIFTDFPTYQAAVEALSPNPSGQAPAVDFLNKKDGPKAMIVAVQEAIASHVHLKRDLIIHWRPDGGGISFAHLVCSITSEDELARLPDRTAELADLFRALFYDYDQITIARVIWDAPTRIALEVFAYAQQREESFIVILGQKQVIRRERETRAQHVPSTGDYIIKLFKETMHFGAMATVLTGADLEDLQPFARIYRENTYQFIRATLENLYQVTLAPWYQQARFLEEHKTLLQLCREKLALSQADLEFASLQKKLASLAEEADIRGEVKINLTRDQISLQFGSGSIQTYINPARHIADYEQNKIPDVVCGITPGGLETDTVLVSPYGETWLTDLSKSGPAPVWWDFVTLEAFIRFQLTTPINLPALWDFETQLLEADHLSEAGVHANVDADYTKLLRVIQTLRGLAVDIAGDVLESYCIGLLFCVLKCLVTYNVTLKYTDQEMRQALYNLMLAAMLSDKIVQLQTRAAAPTSTATVNRELRIDEHNHEVWIGEHLIDLTNTEFELLRYLYQHAGNLCHHADIMREVFHLENGGQNDQKSLITTNIGRLRKKLERDTTEPEYIITVRGLGYKLITDPP